jgi:ribose transport system substrate-binding protein
MDQAGILKKVKVGTFNGVSPALELIRKGQLTASVGGAMEWGAWAAMDNMNRMLAGDEAVEQNVPIRLITAENVDTIEPGGPWTGDIDFRAEYQKIWDGK